MTKKKKKELIKKFNEAGKRVIESNNPIYKKGYIREINPIAYDKFWEQMKS